MKMYEYLVGSCKNSQYIEILLSLLKKFVLFSIKGARTKLWMITPEFFSILRSV
jgi:hypothetical protein